MQDQVPTTFKTVGQLVAERPERGRVFDRFGIDYCCGGRKTLHEACAARGLDVEHVQVQLEAADSIPVARAEPDWTTAQLSDLARHIEETHHELMRRELPRLGALIKKVASAHGHTKPELRIWKLRLLSSRASWSLTCPRKNPWCSRGSAYWNPVRPTSEKNGARSISVSAP